MSKKKRVSVTKKIQESNFKNTSGFPSIEEVNEATAKLTGENAKRQKGRPKATHNRERFTTLISPKKRDKIKLIALMRKVSISDLFDEAADQIIKKYSDALKL